MLKECQRCGGILSFYETEYFDGLLSRTIDYRISLCWRCGYFNITPEILTPFTESLLSDPTIIINLIKKKKLKPVKH